MKIHLLGKHNFERDERFEEMKEKTCDEATEKAHKFVSKEAKKFRKGY